MIWVGQFGIVDGEAQQESPWVGLFPEPGRAEPEESADLFVVVEPASPGSEEHCRDLAQAIGKLFRERRVSLTGGVLRALRAVHEDLRDWNRRSLKEHRVAAGVSCLAVRDGEAYLAQVAPAAAVLLQAGAVSRLHPTLPDSVEPLGLYEEFWPDFSHHRLHEGDRMLLLSKGLAGALSDQQLTEALRPHPEETLPLVYRQARGMPRAAALLVAVLPEVPA